MTEHWVCRACIGHDNFEQYTIGLIGKATCEVCGTSLPQPLIAYVSDVVYEPAKLRIATKTKESP